MKIRERVTSRRAPLVLTAALGALLLVSGCGQTYPQSIWTLHSDLTNQINGLFTQIIVLGVIVFVVVEGALLFILLRYRRKPGDDTLPPQTHGSTVLEVAWTLVPVIILLSILTPTIKTIFETQAAAPPSSLSINVVGHQFWWEFDYPNGVATADEIHMPVNQTVNLVMTSNDVIHGFFLPALAAGRDVNPGSTNYIWFTPNAIGEFPGQCVQLCGYSHANMRMKAFVDNDTDFQTWLAAQAQPAVTPTDGDAAAGAQLFQERGCAGCHTINGTAAQAKVGPNLTHFASRTTLAGAVLDSTPDNVRTWLKDPPAVKPGSIMPNLNLSDSDLTQLVAYLGTLK